MIRKLAAILLLSGLIVAPATAGALSARDRSDIERIERYLNDITTLRSRILQASSDGGITHGTLFLSRPGRLRFEYEQPSPILIVANGRFLIYVDNELQQISHFPISSTPVGVLLEDNVRLTEKHDVVALEREPGTIAITLAMKDDHARGTVRFLFSDRPLALRKWRVQDARGAEVTVSLLSLEQRVDLPQRLFTVDPDLFDGKDE